MHIHKRVAKEFLVHGKGGVVIKRGYIVSASLISGINLFLIRYDDKTVEHATNTSVVAMRKFFNQVGNGDDTQCAKENTPFREKMGLKVRTPPSQNKKRSKDASDKSEKKKTPPSQNKKRSKDTADESDKKKHKKNSNSLTDPLNCIGKNIAKFFGDEIYYGKVTSYSKDLGGLWHIKFNDGDEEDLNREEVSAVLKLWIKKNPEEVINIM